MKLFTASLFIIIEYEVHTNLGYYCSASVLRKGSRGVVHDRTRIVSNSIGCDFVLITLLEIELHARFNVIPDDLDVLVPVAGVLLVMKPERVHQFVDYSPVFDTAVPGVQIDHLCSPSCFPY